MVAELRARGSLPEQTDALFVVDARNVLRGSLPIDVLLLGDPSAPVASLVNADVVTFAPEAEAAQAARSFERYDLVSAPVVDDRGKLIGRLTVDVVMDVLREEAERRELSRAGLRGEEDMFASTWASARNRWPWLCVNLVTAFAASRVIGAFEHTISQLVALAALMPMVASVGGNTGNQTSRWSSAAWRSTRSAPGTAGAWSPRSSPSRCSTAWCGAASWAWAPSSSTTACRWAP